MKPQWIIYKNDFAIGQAITWHKALSNLCITEHLDNIIVKHLTDGLVLVLPVNIGQENSDRYRIIKQQ